MNDSSTNTIEASNKARAISRAADVLAAYMSDDRGWASPTTGPEVMAASDDSDVDSALSDLIADLMHLADYIGGDDYGEVKADSARNHYSGERTGDLDAPWDSIPRDLVHYVPEVEA